MHGDPRTARCLALAVIGAALASCHRDEAPPPQPLPTFAYPSPPPTYAYPAPPVQAAAMPPAFGFYCQTEGDFQCPYAHCVGGRCGGCLDDAQCKPGAFCAPSVMGMACWPDYRANRAPPPIRAPELSPPAAPSPPIRAPEFSGDPFAQARQSCVDRINAYRARVGRAPLVRDTASEPCADGEAQSDARANTAHGSFGRCGEHAQNACPDYPGRSADDVLAACLEQMFGEGPGGGHFDNMTSTRYGRVFCGIEPQAGGRFWIVQDFR